MVVDGLTKGRADRTPLATAMSGSYILNHVCHEYEEPTTTPTGQSVQREAVAAPSLRQPEGQGRPTTITTCKPYGNQINPLNLNFITGNPKATHQLHIWYNMPTFNGR